MIEMISGGELSVMSCSLKRLRISVSASDSWKGLFLWRRLYLLILQIFKKNFWACDLTWEPVRDWITSSTFFQSFPKTKTAEWFSTITFQKLNVLLRTPPAFKECFLIGLVAGAGRGRATEVLLH
jgi:hypothetical protein